MDSIGVIGEKVSKKTQGKPFLPDELITDILSRLPPTSIVKCRHVCRGWRDLTLLPDFVDLINRNSNPTIFVTNPRSYSRLDLFALDMWWDSSSTKKMIHRFPFYSGKFPNRSRALFSHTGLIVLQENPSRVPVQGAHYNIINPVMPIHECVRITLSKQLWRSKIYGVYFHPILKEYCSLWRIDTLNILRDSPRQTPYKILTLGSNPSLRTISYNPGYDRGIKGATLFINNCLYWLLERPRVWSYNGRNDIMEFNIISEEFTVIPCPVPWNTECKCNETSLLNIDGILSFLLIFPRKINIWRLEDQADERLWTTVEYTLNIEISLEPRLVIAVVDGKLALVTKGGSLLVCNLMEGTVSNYPDRKYKNDVLLSHQMSLVSLSNCKPTITIDLDLDGTLRAA